jgi:decaprenyl-phosphate phosphoribosyltransferase
MARHGNSRLAPGRERADRPSGPSGRGHEETVARRPPGGLGRALLVTARPRQWAKNVLVFGAPITGHALLEPRLVAKATLAFVAFCLASSGMYYVNDIVDRRRDQAHPRKRFRPIAAGQLRVPLALAVAVLLVVGGLTVATWSGGLEVGAIVAVYVALTLAYTLVLRGIVLVDLAAVAGGFILRAAAGGVAVDVPLSSWFLIVTCFGALFIATGKRLAEHTGLGGARGEHRKTLDEYSEPYLRYLLSSASTVTIAAYCLWAFEGATGGSLASALSILPFVLGIYRYAMLLDSGRGGAPEEVVLGDRPLQLCGLCWVLLVGLGVYLG